MKEKALIDWVESFMRRHRLFAEYGVVGLSGGADSLLLSHVLEALKARGHFKSLLHLHINHGLRSNSSEQACQLADYAQNRSWHFEQVSLDGSSIKSNIEMWARQERYQAFHARVGKLEGSRLYLGHHIDDSFEWFIRQIAGSSSSGLAFGIPLVNGIIRRPFHCLTKEQINRFCHRLELPVIHDQSNESLAFQRNAISKEVKQPLLKLFPKGLAHYVRHANEWAQTQAGVRKKPGLIQKKISDDLYSLTCFTDERQQMTDWAQARHEIVGIITKLSSKKRGELRQNLDKLVAASAGDGARGPLAFSGGVKVFIYPGSLYFTKEQGLELKAQASDIPLRVLTIEEAKKEFDAGNFTGLIAFAQKKLFGLGGLKRDELFQGIIDDSKKSGASIRPLAQLYQKASATGQLNKKFKGRLI